MPTIGIKPLTVMLPEPPAQSCSGMPQPVGAKV
jgi:hypothetical protein